MNLNQSTLLLILGIALLGLPGCGETSKLPEGDTGTVSGTLTIDSKPPAPGASVVMQHKGKGITASGVVGSDGSFKMITRGESAILAGDYLVGVTPAPAPPMTPEQEAAVNEGKPAPAAPPTDIPAKYHTPERSGLTFTVKAGTNPPWKLELKK